MTTYLAGTWWVKNSSVTNYSGDRLQSSELGEVDRLLQISDPFPFVDQLGRPTVTAGNDNYIFTHVFVRPSQLFKISQNKTIFI